MINPTIVIFNDRLKAFIEKIKDNIDISRLSHLHYINLILNDIFECQKEIRNFISSNKNCFDTITYKKNYQRVICLLLLY